MTNDCPMGCNHFLRSTYEASGKVHLGLQSLYSDSARAWHTQRRQSSGQGRMKESWYRVVQRHLWADRQRCFLDRSWDILFLVYMFVSVTRLLCCSRRARGARLHLLIHHDCHGPMSVAASCTYIPVTIIYTPAALPRKCQMCTRTKSVSLTMCRNYAQ